MKKIIELSLERVKHYLRSSTFLEGKAKKDFQQKPSKLCKPVIDTREEHYQTIENLLRVVEERTRTLEYVARQAMFASSHQIDIIQRLYIELSPHLLDLSNRRAFNDATMIELKSNYPIALDSNDHINPDSTVEGVSRPTLFVKNCTSVLGEDIKCLDLGAGAAGLVFDFAMNGVFALGVDGSDFCRLNRIGYWPLLPNNLFTCDITKPFHFVSRETQTMLKFNIITMWEVLEHIAENDLPGLFLNIVGHLDERGYFIGSISLLEYVDATGSPYHVTLKPREWWTVKFKEYGLVMLDTHPFNEKFFCRGNGPRFQDFHNYAKNWTDGFWFVAQKAKLC